MAAPVVIDPNTGERVNAQSVQIDPATGERISSAEAPKEGFLHSLGATLGITPESAKQKFEDAKANPVKSLADAVVGPAGDVARSLFEQGKQTFNSARQAVTDYRSGNKAQAAVDAIQAVPVIGPGMVKATDQYAAGDTAGEMGTLLGTAAQAAPMALGLADSAGVPRPDTSLSRLNPSALKVSAGEMFQAVAKDANKVPVDIANSQDAALKLMNWQGKTQLGPTVNKFLNRITNPKLGPLTYSEARDYYQLLGSLSADEASKLPGPVRRDLTQMVTGLKVDIGNSADQVGKAAEYYKAMGDYSTAMRLQGWYDFAKKSAVKAAIGSGLTYEAYRQYQKQ